MAVAALYGELRALGSFAASSLALLVVGGLLTLATPSVEEVIVPQALLFSSMAWLVAAGALPLALSGLMTPLDAICHAMTALATGGLSTRTANIGAFNSPIIEAVLIAFMLVGATNFHVHLDVLRGRLREALSSMELQAMLAIVAAATALVSLDLVVHLHLPLSDAVRASVFQVASIATTTGYTSIDVNVLPPASRWTLICLMVVGGCLCSTAGGIKVARAVALAKMAKLEVHRSVLPREAIVSLKVRGRVVGDEDALRIMCFLFTYLTLACIAAIVITHQGVPFFIDLFRLDWASKVALIACMWMGRLELIPVLSTVMPEAWRRAS